MWRMGRTGIRRGGSAGGLAWVVGEIGFDGDGPMVMRDWPTKNHGGGVGVN